MFKLNKKNIQIFLISVAFFLSFIFLVHVGLAQVNTGINYAEATGLGKQDIRITIVKVIRIFLGFLGIIAVFVVMYAGWLWMSSEGNQEQISRAKRVLSNGIVGIIIILSSFAITSFILNKLMEVTGSIPPSPNTNIKFTSGLGSSGNRIIESHYPARNQKNVPRNTSIIITFKEPMNIADLITGSNINIANILIYKTSDGLSGPHVTNVLATTTDGKTFRFKPVDYLGSPSEKVWYTVALSGNIHKADGNLAFPGNVSGIGYDWSFEVSNIIDITPPKIMSIIPIPDSEEPRNVVIQINFNEAIDPLSASGHTSTFNNIVITDLGASTTVDGNFYISNEYKTVEFLTEDACGVNSCGNTIYCLPANANLNVLIKAATLINISEPAASFPFDGIVDMAENSLDGNKNDIAQGPQSQSGFPPFNANNPDTTTQGDDYTWTFKTNSNIDISSPVIESISPTIGEMGVDLNSEPKAVFNKILMSSSLTKNTPPGSGSIALYADLSAHEVFYWIGKHNNTLTNKTTITIKHEDFVEGASYVPEFNAGIKDIYQNCYTPSAGPGCTPNPPAQPYCCDGILSNVSCNP